MARRVTVIHVLENSGIVLEGTPAVGACGGGHRGCGLLEVRQDSSATSSLPLFATTMSQNIETEGLARFTELMNELLPVLYFP